MLWKIFGPKRDEVTREWRKLHNEAFNDIYSSPNNFRASESRRMRRVYRILVGKSEGKRPLGGPRRRWKENIKMDLQGVG